MNLHSLQQRIDRFLNAAWFAVPLALLIVLSVFLIFFEFFLPQGEARATVESVNDLITVFFIVELALRAWVAPSKQLYLKTYWLDLLSVLPVFRAARALRVLRLLRLLRLGRATVLILRHGGWLSERAERHIGSLGALTLASMLLVISATLASFSLDSGVGDSIEPAVFFERSIDISMLFTTGEFSGVSPGSTTHKVLHLLVSLSGLVVFALLVGMVAASMESFVKSQIESKDVMLSDLRGHLLVCGWDRAALLVLRSLQNQPRKWSKGVVIIAEVEEQLDKLFPNSVAGRLFHVRADYTRFEVLESCGAQYADSALIFADRAAQLRDQDRDARTVLAALTLEKLNPNIYTCAELMDEQNGAHLKIAGVEEVVSHAALTAQVMARAALERFQEEEQPSIPAEIPIQVADMIRSKGVLLSLEDSLVGSSLAAVASHYRDNQVGLVVGIIGEGQSMPIVDETYVICSGDRLLLVGV